MDATQSANFLILQMNRLHKMSGIAQHAHFGSETFVFATVMFIAVVENEDFHISR